MDCERALGQNRGHIRSQLDSIEFPLLGTDEHRLSRFLKKNIIICEYLPVCTPGRLALLGWRVSSHGRRVCENLCPI